ncbi:MAG: alkaline phosphatase, partial [Rikenellaceae bacterium]
MKLKRKIGWLLLIATLTTTTNVEAKKGDQSGKVKSIIFLIGDGMGLAHVTMSMVEQGYATTIFDEADNIAMQKSYSANNRVTDSAASGTALATGYKTNNGMIGMTPDGEHRESIAALAAKRGMSCGVVATSSIQHATPASFYAHVESRKSYNEIAQQLATSTLSVAIGGGNKFMKQDVDGVNLIDKMRDGGFTVVTTMDELRSADCDKLLGIFAEDGLKSIPAGRDTTYLATATAKALEVLSKDKDGFFLMVEGSQIDWASHANNSKRIMHEMYDFERAIKVAVDFARQHEDVLVVVSADHETGGLSLV